MIDRNYEVELYELIHVLSSIENSVRGMNLLNNRSRRKIVEAKGIDNVIMHSLDNALEMINKLMDVKCEQNACDSIKIFLRSAHKNVLQVRRGFVDVFSVQNRYINEALMDLDYVCAIVAKHIERYERTI